MGDSKAHRRDDAASDEELARLRSAIDAVDRSILTELNKRAELVKQVGELKREGRATVYRAARERDLVDALTRSNVGAFPTSGLRSVFREIISATRSLEARLRIAYLGPEGTFSHAAARAAFGEQADYVPVATIGDVITAVERHEADHGVVPVENSTDGVVTQTLDALIETRLALCGETVLRISHCLLSQSGRLEDVKRVASHPQPLAQCRHWLDRHLPGVTRFETPSTAAAAALATKEADAAAIASALAGELAGLATIAANIEDRRDNTTRFVVLGGDAPAPSGNDLTSLAYTVRKSESGALHRLLAPFAAHGVNLTSIQARPLKGTPWEYVFFIDLEGHHSEQRVQDACADAAKVATSWRVLGSFPRATNLRAGEAG
ncbi:MAG TPA: prephenate dehydratase [Myxococcota bacterium]|nr:prephenate dehydratase [Myxococcota bacterium]